MTKDEALKLALEALEPLVRRAAPWGELDWLNGRKAITAIKEALAQPEQDWKIHPKEDAPLVKWAKEQTPPQRTWVGLTDEELQPIADEYRILFGSWVKDFAQAIETKLRSKNNG